MYSWLREIPLLKCSTCSPTGCLVGGVRCELPPPPLLPKNGCGGHTATKGFCVAGPSPLNQSRLCLFFVHPPCLASLTPAASLHIASGSLTFTPLNKRFMEIAVEMSEYTRRDGAALSGAALKALIVPGSSLSLAKDVEAFTAFTRAMVQTGGCCVPLCVTCVSRARV